MISIKKALEWNTIEQNFPFSSSVLPYAISAINHTPLFTPTSLIMQFIFHTPSSLLLYDELLFLLFIASKFMCQLESITAGVLVEPI